MFAITNITTQQRHQGFLPYPQPLNNIANSASSRQIPTTIKEKANNEMPSMTSTKTYKETLGEDKQTPSFVVSPPLREKKWLIIIK